MNIKISLTAPELKGSTNLFKKFADQYDQDTMNDIAVKQVFVEVHDALHSALFNNRHRLSEPNRSFSKEIPASHALFIMTFFYGLGLTNYDSYVLNKICGQIELQLFIQGDFKAPFKKING